MPLIGHNLSLKKPVTYTQMLVDKSLKYLKIKYFYGLTSSPLISAICRELPNQRPSVALETNVTL